MKPLRVQLSRAKGWRMPANTIKIDRSTQWGNPFKVDARHSAQDAVESFRFMIGEIFEVSAEAPTLPEQIEYSEMFQRGWRELAGKNLACWCRQGQPCHADVLLTTVRLLERREKR